MLTCVGALLASGLDSSGLIRASELLPRSTAATLSSRVSATLEMRQRWQLERREAVGVEDSEMARNVA